MSSIFKPRRSVFLRCFKPGMAVWDIEDLFSECFRPGTAV